jgi:hypothetical protein
MGYAETIQISANGAWCDTRSLNVLGTSVVTTRAWLRIAQVHDEEWLAASVAQPDYYIRELRLHAAELPADIFTFAQRVPATTPIYTYPMERDSVAAIPLRSFDEWWTGLPQETRKNARRAAKRGTEISVRSLDDDLIAGIVELNNESPIRQGRRFPHYGKTFDQVRRDHSAFPGRSEFICAYLGSELTGFAKVVYCDGFATILQLMTRASRSDSRPANAIVVRVVERAIERNLGFVVYGKYRYGKQASTTLMEFKARNGFQEFLLPRYYVPLTALGTAGLRVGLHRGASDLVPAFAIDLARNLRGAWNRGRLPKS